MFEIFNNVKEMTMVFKDDKLVFANETALFYFNSYEISILNTEISNFIHDNDLVKINENFKKHKSFKTDVKLTIGKTITFNFKKIFDSYGEEYLLMQAESENDINKIYDNAIKIVTPKTLYDPLLLGKAAMQNYELSIPFNEISDLINSLMESQELKENAKLNETAKKIEEKTLKLYEKSRQFINDLVDIECKYNITKSIFNINELIRKIEKRIKNYLEIENIDIVINFSTREEELLLSGDYFKISKAIICLISQSIKYIMASNRKGRVFITTKTDDDDIVITIKDNGIGIDEETFKRLHNADICIFNIDENSLDKTTVNIHLINTYIELNGGSLYINNEKQKGTISIIRLPLAKKRYLLEEKNSEKVIDLNSLIEEELNYLHF